MMRSNVPDPDRDEILDPKLGPTERTRLLQTAHQLEHARPLPRPDFRGKLARRLRTRPADPERVRMLISAYAGSGLLLLMVVAIGLAGIGPLASG
jgi:hypothetical protein